MVLLLVNSCHQVHAFLMLTKRANQLMRRCKLRSLLMVSKFAVSYFIQYAGRDLLVPLDNLLSVVTGLRSTDFVAHGNKQGDPVHAKEGRSSIISKILHSPKENVRVPQLPTTISSKSENKSGAAALCRSSKQGEATYSSGLGVRRRKKI